MALGQQHLTPPYKLASYMGNMLGHYNVGNLHGRPEVCVLTEYNLQGFIGLGQINLSLQNAHMWIG